MKEILNMRDIEEAIKTAKRPKPMGCGECNEMLYSPMDKLSIGLYGKCSLHLKDDGIEANNLLKLSESL